MKKYPFKFLDAYSKDDTDIFFGRDEEIEALYEMIFQTNILLIYGASGTGKTSLIQCGLETKFQPHDRLPVYIRRGNNLNNSLEKKLAELKGSEIEDDLDWLDDISDDSSTPEATKQLTPIQKTIQTIYQNNFKPIYLIFDQFEELYIIGNKPEQNQFIETVKEIIEIDQPIKLIFSVREEYLGYLYEFEKAVPQLLRKKIRVEPMNIDKVRQVIEGATTLKNSNISIKEQEKTAITEIIFDKIKSKKELTIQLPYLQVFLDKLYMTITNDESRNAEAEFTVESLKAIGNIGDVLSDFLEEQVKYISVELKNSFTEIDTKKVWAILSPFATLEGTKDPLSKAQLFERLPDIDKKLIKKVLNLFVNRRILRHSETDDLYELAHDTLAQRVAEKRTDDEIALLEVRRLIKSQTSMKAEARETFTEKQLVFIEPYLQKLKLTDQENNHIAESRREVEKQKNAKTKRQRMIITIVSVAAVVSILFGIFGFVNMFKAQKSAKEAISSRIMGIQRDAQTHLDQERYELAKEKYKLLINTYKKYPKLNYDYEAVSKRIIKCRELDSLSKIFYENIDIADSLAKLTDIDNFVKADSLYKFALNLKYEKGEDKITPKIEALDEKRKNIIANNIATAKTYIKAPNKLLFPEAKELLLKLQQLDPENKIIIDLLKQVN